MFGGENGAALDDKNTVKHGVGNIILWGIVAASVIGNTVWIEGRMNSSKYQQILDPDVLQSVKRVKLKRGWGPLLQPRQAEYFCDGPHSSLTSTSLKNRGCKAAQKISEL